MCLQLEYRQSLVRYTAFRPNASDIDDSAHSGAHILGPLKSHISREMGASNTEFSLLIAAFTLNSTWTPLGELIVLVDGQCID